MVLRCETSAWLPWPSPQGFLNGVPLNARWCSADTQYVRCVSSTKVRRAAPADAGAEKWHEPSDRKEIRLHAPITSLNGDLMR